MRALLTSHGSTGDIFPVIRLGKALLDAGHEVRFVTVRHFQPEVERAGLTFVAVPPNWDQQGFAEAMRELTHVSNSLALLEKIYREAIPYVDEVIATLSRELEWADVFVGSYLFPYLANLARVHGVPSAVLTFAHNAVPSSDYPPDGVPAIRGFPGFLQDRWNRMFWRLGDRVIGWRIQQVFKASPGVRHLVRDSSFALAPADKVLVTVSRALFEPKRLWSERFAFTGYLRWQAPEDPEIEQRVADFCEGKRVPFLTFGSVTFDEARLVMTRFMRHWPPERKVIIQSGWAGLTIEHPRPETLRIGKCSHDQLLPRYASVMIHHGGAGTTASALHAGVPQIIIPHIGDQWFFASEVERLGTGVELKRKHWPERLPELIRKVEERAGYTERARDVAAILRSEDGPGNAVAVLEKLVADGLPQGGVTVVSSEAGRVAASSSTSAQTRA